jgi:hypothetical protein
MHTTKNNFHSESRGSTNSTKHPVPDKITSTNKKKDWPTLILDWEKSGLTKQEFCILHGLNYNTFSYHRGKSIKEQDKHAKLLSVKMRADKPLPSSQPMACFTLHFPNGTKLSIPEHADPSTLKILLSVLGDE